MNLLRCAVVAIVAPIALHTQAQGIDGARIFQQRCATCHVDSAAAATDDANKAPALAAMRILRGENIYRSLAVGAMHSQVAGLSENELRALVAFVTGAQTPEEPAAQPFCENRSVDLTRINVGGWGLDASSTRFISGAATRINARNVHRLELAWAFGLPATETVRSQPVVAGSTLFMASTSRDLFALDRNKGCVRWHYVSYAPLRTSLALGAIGERFVVFVGDVDGFMNAVDAANGKLLWRTYVGLMRVSILTGAPVIHGDRLVVPVSAWEVVLAGNPEYECCKAHGAVHLLNAVTGKILWTTHLTPDAVKQGVSSVGTLQWGPSGAPVWSTPTVDAKRGLIYVATGENYSSPATQLSDAIVALRLDTGQIEWHFQATKNDAWNMSCGRFVAGPNCPKERGPDFDFGASVIIAKNAVGEDVLLAGQKSGEVFALDPDAKGRLLWRRKVGAGSKLGGVHWGMAATGGRLYVPIADPAFSLPNYRPRPGMYALSIDDGHMLWSARATEKCAGDAQVCRLHYRLSAASTALPGVVFGPGLDGQLRAFSASDGELLWRQNTALGFRTVNGVEAHGGSIDSAGVIAVDDMIYVQSGYGTFRQMPGNVLLAYRLRAAKAGNDAIPQK